jgi:dTDP-4-dehydrorhamnose 3,5-epimerase-like enzyme
MQKIKLHKLPLFTDERGQLVPVELKEYIDWEPKRIYYAFNNKQKRGGHAHRIEKELFICAKGFIVAKVHDGEKWQEHKLEGPGDAIYVDNYIWHEFTDFSEDAILLAVSSTNYNPDDYIRDLDHFLKEINK